MKELDAEQSRFHAATMVSILDNGNKIGEAEVREDGSWSFLVSSVGEHRMTARVGDVISNPERIFTIVSTIDYDFEDCRRGTSVRVGSEPEELLYFTCVNSNMQTSPDRVYLHGASDVPHGLGFSPNGQNYPAVATLEFTTPITKLYMRLQHRVDPPRVPVDLSFSYSEDTGPAFFQQTVTYPAGGSAQDIIVRFDAVQGHRCKFLRITLEPVGGLKFEICLNSFVIGF